MANVSRHIVFGLLLGFGQPTWDRPVLSQDQPSKVTIAVVDFGTSAMSNRERYADAGKGISALLGGELSTAPNVTIVEHDRVQEIVAEIDLQRSGKVDAETAVKIGKLLGAQYLVIGTVFVDPKERMVLQGRVVNVETRGWDIVARADGKGDDVFALVSQIGQELTKKLNVLPPRGVSRTSAPREGAAVDAFISYSAAQRACDERKRDQCIQYARRALEIYPGFADAEVLIRRAGGL